MCLWLTINSCKVIKCQQKSKIKPMKWGREEITKKSVKSKSRKRTRSGWSWTRKYWRSGQSTRRLCRFPTSTNCSSQLWRGRTGTRISSLKATLNTSWWAGSLSQITKDPPIWRITRSKSSMKLYSSRWKSSVVMSTSHRLKTQHSTFSWTSSWTKKLRQLRTCLRNVRTRMQFTQSTKTMARLTSTLAPLSIKWTARIMLVCRKRTFTKTHCVRKKSVNSFAREI